MVHAFTLNLVGSAASITDTTFLEQVYGLGPDPDAGAVEELSRTLISEKPISELPVAIPEQLLSGFVSPNNTTMLVVFTFDVTAAYC